MKTFQSLTALFILMMTLSAQANAAEKRLWGQLSYNNLDEAAGGVEGGGVVSHLSMVSFHREGNVITKFKASIPIRCQSVDGYVSYHDYVLTGTVTPNLRISGSRVARRNFSARQGDLLLDDVQFKVSGRFSSATKGSFTVILTTEHNSAGQSACVGSISMSNVKRGVVVR